MIKHVFHVRKN